LLASKNLDSVFKLSLTMHNFDCHCLLKSFIRSVNSSPQYFSIGLHQKSSHHKNLMFPKIWRCQDELKPALIGSVRRQAYTDGGSLGRNKERGWVCLDMYRLGRNWHNKTQLCYTRARNFSTRWPRKVIKMQWKSCINWYSNQGPVTCRPQKDLMQVVDSLYFKLRGMLLIKSHLPVDIPRIFSELTQPKNWETFQRFLWMFPASPRTP